MLQVVQPASGGPVRVIEVPRPIAGPTEVLVRTIASVLSPGTERAVTKLARSSLISKARARPDLVRKVVQTARSDGLIQTARSVRARLDEDVPLGYSAAGIVVEVGAYVADLVPGQLVATGGAGKANHAEFQAVPGLLCTPVPDGVAADDAAFATIASIALHGLRLGEIEPGCRVAVVGLGLVGQLTVRLAIASGCSVAGIDVTEFAVNNAREAGAVAHVDSGEETTKAVQDWSRGRGADAVIVAAATTSSAVMARVPELCRDRGTVVVVGDVGLELDRRPLYERELSLRFARSYGPGRYERSYEDWGVDYPPGDVRWTEGRNQEAVLDLMNGGRMHVSDLVTHRFPIADASRAYGLVETRGDPYFGIQLTYPAKAPDTRSFSLGPRPSKRNEPGIGLIGAGAFANSVLVPALKAAGFERFVSVASASGLSARRLGEREGFERVVAGADAIIDDPEVHVVVIATPHDSHAKLAARALRAGKHVFCEKPLALSFDEFAEVETAQVDGSGVLFVDFNRRWSPAVRLVQDHLADRHDPVTVLYRVNSAEVDASHWYHDRRQGGRLLGEVCHFIDTCAAIVGVPAADVAAFGSGEDESLLSENIALALRYPDGSLAAISYSAADDSGMGKERIEVFGRAAVATIVDFREVKIGHRRVAHGNQDKGHHAAAREFRRAISASESARWPLATTRTALEAAARLGLLADRSP